MRSAHKIMLYLSWGPFESINSLPLLKLWAFIDCFSANLKAKFINSGSFEHNKSWIVDILTPYLLLTMGGAFRSSLALSNSTTIDLSIPNSRHHFHQLYLHSLVLYSKFSNRSRFILPIICSHTMFSLIMFIQNITWHSCLRIQ